MENKFIQTNSMIKSILFCLLALTIFSCTDSSMKSKIDQEAKIKELFYEMKMEKYLSIDELEIPEGIALTEVEIRAIFERHKKVSNTKEASKPEKNEKEKFLELIKNSTSEEEKSKLIKEAINKGFFTLIK